MFRKAAIVPVAVLALSVVLPACQARNDFDEDELYTTQAKQPVAVSPSPSALASTGRVAQPKKAPTAVATHTLVLR